LAIATERSGVTELNMRNPWVFTAVNTVIWVLVWSTVQVLLFDGGDTHTCE